jgi:membrane protein DedA with SNARE-associated domain
MPDFLAYSYIGLVLVIILTGCGLPIPEEVPVIAAGVAASLGKLDPLLAFICCLAGGLVGDAVMYGLGRYFGRGLIKRAWFRSLVNEETEARAERMIFRHGLKVFLAARFLVGIRAPLYVSAGILRVPLSRFLMIDAICATIVIGTVFGLSYLYGPHVETAWRWLHALQIDLTIILGAAAVVLVLLYWWHRRKSRAHRQLDESPAVPDQAVPEQLPEREKVA